MRVHCDQSYDGAEMLLRRYLPDEAEELVKRRYQIINASNCQNLEPLKHQDSLHA
jgi:hypothetical protein